MGVPCTEEWRFGGRSKTVRYVIPPVTDTNWFTMAAHCQGVVYRYHDRSAIIATVCVALTYSGAPFMRLERLTMPRSRSYRWRPLPLAMLEAPRDAHTTPSVAKVILNRLTPRFRRHAEHVRCAGSGPHLNRSRWRDRPVMRHGRVNGERVPATLRRGGRGLQRDIIPNLV